MFDLLLVLHSKTLFFVNNQQTEIFETHILRKHPVGSDDNVELPGSQFFQDILLFTGGSETAQYLDVEGRVLEPFKKSGKMLLGENGGWNQDCNLFFLRNSFESRPHRNFRFAETDITTDQTVHRHF